MKEKCKLAATSPTLLYRSVGNTLLAVQRIQQQACLVQALPEVNPPHSMEQPEHIISVVAVIQQRPALCLHYRRNKAYEQLKMRLLLKAALVSHN
jgi:hypothetical protein